jgi:hypothetical protein
MPPSMSMGMSMSNRLGGRETSNNVSQTRVHTPNQLPKNIKRLQNNQLAAQARDDIIQVDVHEMTNKLADNNSIMREVREELVQQSLNPDRHNEILADINK